MSPDLEAPVNDPEYVNITQARRHLGNCGRGYVYKLIEAGLLESINPLGRMRLVSMQSIRRLVNAGKEKNPAKATEEAA
jgi:hypothetical protein